ncbi:flagellar hook-basal body complex protein FliE [Limnobacter sp.]|uniref:flagellar hook-basal body complex protein FliE n=1 Tax=Limnobacter sp. TaxID=2003368 RepID=UPI00351528A8
MIETSRLPGVESLALSASRQSPLDVQGGKSIPSFTEVLGQALDSVNKAQEQSRSLAVGLQMNNPKVSVEDVAIASNEASLKFQTVLQTRNKLLQAYSEIMSMPV